jgi:6-phosphofructo-2-kinase
MEGLNLDMRNKLVIVMVGLPARGKSYVTKKLCRYLNWLQYEVKIFNVGDRRRTKQRVVSNLLSSDPGADVHKKLEAEKHAASFFNFENTDARKFREAVAMETLDELLDYLTGNHGSVALFDATNTTVTRRKSIVQKIRERGGNDLQILFLESQCFNESVCPHHPTVYINLITL